MSMRKGISLPVEMIVIIALAVIVLLAAGAFFIGGIGPNQGQVTDVTAWQRACGTLKLRGCSATVFADLNTMVVQGYDPDKNGVDNSALDACRRALSQPNARIQDCQQDCCQMTSTALFP